MNLLSRSVLLLICMGKPTISCQLRCRNFPSRSVLLLKHTLDAPIVPMPIPCSRITCGITVRFIRPPIVLLRGLHIIRLSKASQRVGSRQNRLQLLPPVPLLPLLHRSPASLMEVSVPSRAPLLKHWQATMLVSIMRPRLHLLIIHGMNSNNTSPSSSNQQTPSPSTSK